MEKERWIDAHSVHCCDCEALIDERECHNTGDDDAPYRCIQCHNIREAAPELLAALQELCKTPADLLTEGKRWDNAIAAIAKARGL